MGFDTPCATRALARLLGTGPAIGVCTVDGRRNIAFKELVNFRRNISNFTNYARPYVCVWVIKWYDLVGVNVPRLFLFFERSSLCICWVFRIFFAKAHDFTCFLDISLRTCFPVVLEIPSATRFVRYYSFIQLRTLTFCNRSKSPWFTVHKINCYFCYRIFASNRYLLTFALPIQR